MDDEKVKITFRMDEETNRMIRAVYQQDKSMRALKNPKMESMNFTMLFL